MRTPAGGGSTDGVTHTVTARVERRLIEPVPRPLPCFQTEVRLRPELSHGHVVGQPQVKWQIQFLVRPVEMDQAIGDEHRPHRQLSQRPP